MVINKSQNDEINLVELIYVIWNGKWKVAVTAIVFVFFAYGYEKTLPEKKFTAKTSIVAIGSMEEDKYIFFNDIIRTNRFGRSNIVIPNRDGDANLIQQDSEQYLTVSRQLLEKLFLEAIGEQLLFEEGIHKYKLLDVNKYANKKKYENAVINLASSVMINKKKSDQKNTFSEINIKFSHYDIEKWKSVLSFVEKSANSKVKKNLQERFIVSMEIAEFKEKYKIEDVKIKIENLIKDYELKTADRLLFLQEQAEISRTLGIAKNTIEVQTFGSQNTMFSAIKTESPFYLRGYEAIEKEIDLIERRTKLDKVSFIDGLMELEQAKRRIQQNKTLNRIRYVYQSSPLKKDNADFAAASIQVSRTKFQYPADHKMMKIAILFGLIIGIFFVLISNIITNSNYYKKK